MAAVGWKNPSLPRADAPDGTARSFQAPVRVLRTAEFTMAPGARHSTVAAPASLAALVVLVLPARFPVSWRSAHGAANPWRVATSTRQRPATIASPEAIASPCAVSAPAASAALVLTPRSVCQVRTGAAADAVIPATDTAAAARPISLSVRRIGRG